MLFFGNRLFLVNPSGWTACAGTADCSVSQRLSRRPLPQAYALPHSNLKSHGDVDVAKPPVSANPSAGP
jgi:hypothetical protein